MKLWWLVQLSDGQVVELGSTWLHGLVGNPIYELAVAWGTMDPTLKSEGKKFLLAVLLLVPSHGA